MESLEAAILRTVLYGDIFNFPMTLQEVHHFLIYHEAVPFARVEHTVKTSEILNELLEFDQGYIVCAGRRELVALRMEREQSSQLLLPIAIQYGHWLARLPFVRMVALTGALAMRNAAHDDDDLDYLLVTAPRRVWLARAFAIVVVRLARRRGVVICPNYVLSETALTQDRQDLFIAHEVTQMIPLYGHDLYVRLRGANRWADEHLPNAGSAFYCADECQVNGIWGAVKRGAEWMLDGRLGDLLESWEHRRKLRRFASEMRTPHNAARLDEQRVKGHFQDHGHPVLRKYYERLQRYGLVKDVLVPAGD